MLRKYRKRAALVVLVYVAVTHVVVVWDYVAPHVCLGVRMRQSVETDDACLL